MTFEEYQKLTSETAIYPNKGDNYIYPSLGLANEVGEFLGRVKKVMRDTNGIITQENKIEMMYELGDSLWYLSQVATELGLSLDIIAESNITKLQDRKKRGVLGGSGDHR